VFAGTVTRGQIALTAFFAALAIWVFVYKAAPKMPDFEVYWKAASRAALAEPLYRDSDASRGTRRRSSGSPARSSCSSCS
jgi:hypothetical protein